MKLNGKWGCRSKKEMNWNQVKHVGGPKVGGGKNEGTKPMIQTN